MDEDKKNQQEEEGFWWNHVQLADPEPVAMPEYGYDDSPSWRKPLIIGVVVAIAIALIGVGALAFLSLSQSSQSQDAPIDETVISTSDVYLTVTAEGANENSTPYAVGVLSPSDGDEDTTFVVERVEGHAGERVRLGSLEEGDYTLRVLQAPVNEDESTYMLPVFDMGFTVGGKGEAVELSLQLEPSVPDVEKVYEWANPLIGGNLKTAYKRISKKGFTASYLLADGTDKTSVVEGWSAAKRAKATVLEINDVDAGAKTMVVVYEKPVKKKKAKSKTKAAASSSETTSSGGTSSGNSNSQTTSHTHTWVEQTKTVHHDAVYKTVKHAAVKERHTFCNVCGADITGQYTTHKKETGHTSYSYKNIVIQKAYKERVLVSAAYNEKVTTGYKCSVCGATRSAS